VRDANEEWGPDPTLTLGEPGFGPVRVRGSGGGAQLVVLVGRDAGRRYPVGEDQVIGRGHHVDVPVDDDGISRRHARIRRIGPDRYRVEDLGSRNGTYLNGIRVEEGDLEFGDKVAVGEGTVFLFARRDAFEDRLLMAQRLHVLGQLAGGMGHDFNNLLGAALTNITHLRDLPQIDANTLTASLAEVELAVRRAVGLATQLLAFAQTRRPVLRVVDVTRLLEGAARLLRRTLGREVTFVGDIEPELQVRGDSSMLFQALMNVCINAADAMPTGGELLLVGRREAGVAGKADQVLVAVEDTGVGMDDATRERLFEPLFTTKPRGRGSGMGLAHVYATVRDHGGSIEVQSDPGDGTRVELRFPSFDEADAGRHPSGPWPSFVPPEGGVVLLVDDEELVRFALGRVLTHAGLEVLTACDGAEALEVWAREGSRIGVVILDLDMPVLDGEQAFRGLRERDPRAKVLISSGMSNPERENELLAAGVNGILRKPYDATTLLNAVGTVLRHDVWPLPGDDE
jgi:signal transduction histidine kinase/CheY-like chemotaxis protein